MYVGCAFLTHRLRENCTPELWLLNCFVMGASHFGYKGPTMTKSQLLRLTSLLALRVLISSLASAATCSAPSTAGVKICGPGNGTTANYPAEITASARGN